jgi:transposase
MSLASADLPSDLDALRAFVLACQAELKAAEISVQLRTLEIEKLKFQIARLRRMQFGRSSERITRQIEQLELQLEELETGEAEDITKAEAEDRPAPVRERAKPKRKPLPDHLPRREIVHEPDGDRASTCPDCGAGMARLGEDVTEVLDYVPGHFQVIRHVRPKYACEACDTITQAPGPALPTPRGRATPATLAHLLVSKYCDHLPLYRQSEIYAREGVELDRSIGYAGFEALYERPLTDPRRLANAGITEVACWAHCRRKFFDVWDGKKSPVAKEAIDRIAAFYAIEAKARFAPPAERIAHRAETVPLLASFFDWAEKVATLMP